MKDRMSDLQRAALEAGAILLPMAGEVRPAGGLLCAANESTFNASFFSEPLTTFVTGWKDPVDLQALLQFMAPEITVGRRFEFKKSLNAESFLTEDDDIRALDADFKRVQINGETALGLTQNKGLVMYVDLDRVANEPGWENRRAAWLWQRLLRNEVRRAVTGLSNGATNVAKTWAADSDPDADMADALDAGGDSAGFEPNRAICGKGAWLKRFKSFRAQDNAGAFASSAMTPEQLASQFGLDQFLVSKARYQSGASTKTKVVGDIVVFFFAEDGQLADDPSNVKRFVSPVEGGGKMRVYRQEISSKIVAISVEHYSSIVVIQSTGLRKITVA